MGIASTVAGRAERPEPQLGAGRDIPSLDGLRALSILIVILSHTKWYLPAPVANSGFFRYIIGGGLHGVQVFFVISGYLITTLLIREFDKTGTISFKRFYMRRSLRIFPPFYAYLAVLGLLWGAHVVPEHLPSFLAAATYTIAYLPNPQGWPIQHAWSLSIEEQFYLLWPLLLLWSYRRRASTNLALLLIAIMPLVRVILYFAAPHQGGNESHAIVMSGSADTLMVGCMLARIKNHLRWKQWHRRYINASTAGAMTAVGFVLVPYLTLKLKGEAGSVLTTALGNTITSLCIGGILVYAVENQGSIAGRFLNHRMVRHVGVISYSLYLWQQLFTSDTSRMMPYGYVYAFVAAELSYQLIEKPVSRFRSRLRI